MFNDFDSKEAQKLYLWHIATRRNSGLVDSNKSTIDVFLPHARQLFDSMKEVGFQKLDAVPVDPNLDILDGSHRVACALALNEDVWVRPLNKLAWAPPWDAPWFRRYGISEEDVEGLLKDYMRLKGI